MAMHRQASAVLVVCQIKKLLKELGIKDTDKEVKARVVVWYQSEQSDLLFAQTWQVKLIGGGKPARLSRLNFFKPSGKGSTKLLRYIVLYISCNNRIGFVPVKFSNCNRFFSVSYAVSIPHLI